MRTPGGSKSMSARPGMDSASTKAAALSRKPPVVLDAEQHVRGLAA